MFEIRFSIWAWNSCSGGELLAVDFHQVDELIIFFFLLLLLQILFSNSLSNFLMNWNQKVKSKLK